jgi:hypothetical protein
MQINNLLKAFASSTHGTADTMSAKLRQSPIEHLLADTLGVTRQATARQDNRAALEAIHKPESFAWASL